MVTLYVVDPNNPYPNNFTGHIRATLKDGSVVALDAKLNFDDNALYRQKDLLAYRDIAEEDPVAAQAKEHDLAYISLDGNIGCMVNGAGLAMATMDIISYAGGAPANFLDVGGGANQEQIENAFGILLSDPHVKAIFINIFGGILRVDVLATAVVAAARKLSGGASQETWSFDIVHPSGNVGAILRRAPRGHGASPTRAAGCCRSVSIIRALR